MRKKIVVFDSIPDYVFGDDELDTVLIWPDEVPCCDPGFRTREILESGEVVDCRIYGYSIPGNAAEYDEIMEDIRRGNGSALEIL